LVRRRVLKLEFRGAAGTGMAKVPVGEGAGGGAKEVVSVAPLRRMRDTLLGLFVGREVEVEAMLVGLVSGEPTILVGPPGTAKTMMMEAIAKMVNAATFYYLLTPSTEPEELFGPLDVKALREGVYRRITDGKLPSAHIALLDEVFKGSSAIRNALLDVILNKRFYNVGRYERLPLLALYCASNEVSSDAEDAAFYDRLTVRCFTDYVDQTLWDELLLRGVALSVDGAGLEPVADVEYVERLQGFVRLRARNAVERAELREKMVRAFAALRAQRVEVSDRRKVKAFIVAAAVSVVAGEPELSPDSLAEAVRLTAVHEREDMERVEKAIAEAGLSTVQEVAQRLMMIETELRNVLRMVKEKGDNATRDDLRALATVMKRAKAEIARVPRHPRYARHMSAIAALASEAAAVLEEIAG